MTLIELMIGLAVACCAVGLLLVLVFKVAAGGQADSASDKAREFATAMGLDVVNAQCTSVAGSSNYLSCTVSHREKDGSVHLKAIQCASKLSFNTGCRLVVGGLQPGS